MGFQKRHQILLFVYTIVLICGFEEIMAMRPLEGEQWRMMKNSLILQSLPKGGQVSPSPGGNPCTYIPGRGSGRCTLGQMNIAGHVDHAGQAFPDHILNFAAATSLPKDQKPNPTS